MRFSTEGVHPRERLSYWREVATRGFVEHDVRLGNDFAFHGSVEIATLPGLVLTTFESDSARVRRSERDAARGDSDDLLLTLHLDGDICVAQNGAESRIRGRNFYLLDPLHPFEVSLKGRNRNLTIKIPRAMLEARVGLTASLTAIPIAEGAAIAELAMGFVEILPSQVNALDAIAGHKVAEQTLDLIALSISAHQRSDGASLSAPKEAARQRIKATVERLLIEHGLKPEQVATQAGISVRYANALLAEEGTSLERYINDRRLERCRAALEDPFQRHRSIGEIAFKWGFSDLAHFSRRFKARYGQAPSEFRRHAALRNDGLENPPT